MNKEQLIEEARKRGIVPGATCKSPTFGNTFIASDMDGWRIDATGGLADGNGMMIWSQRKLQWAEVVTPAPQPEGLVDGMACEPDEHMLAAILAKAKELGIGDSMAHVQFGLNPNVQWCDKNGLRGLGPKDKVGHYWDTLKFITPGEFYDRLCKAKKPEPPIMIGSNAVEFNTGSITVGRTTIDNVTVRAIAAKLKD